MTSLFPGSHVTTAIATMQLWSQVCREETASGQRHEAYKASMLWQNPVEPESSRLA